MRPLINTLAAARKRLARPFAASRDPVAPHAVKDPKLFALLAPVALLCAGLVLGEGCVEANAVGGTSPGDSSGTPLDDRIQTIEAGVSDHGIDSIVAAADLDDAIEVADFHIYNATPAGLDLNFASATCGLAEGAVDSVCGVCKCIRGEGIICADYTCDPAALTFDPDEAAQRQPGDAFRQAPAECDNGASPGESWMDDCNVCTCLGNGLTTCTLKVCPPGPV